MNTILHEYFGHLSTQVKVLIDFQVMGASCHKLKVREVIVKIKIWVWLSQLQSLGAVTALPFWNTEVCSHSCIIPAPYQ